MIRPLHAMVIAVALTPTAWSWPQSPAASPAPHTLPQPAQPPDDTSGSSRQAQGDRPLFRGGVELIQLDVSVLDGQRRPVTGLSASEFTVLENGVPRPVRAFAPIQLPARGPAAGRTPLDAVPPDIATNDVGEREGRLVIILMDRSIPVGEATLTARRIATAAVEALGPHDLAALVSTSGGVPQNLTADRSRLIEAINQREWSTAMTREQQEVFGDPLVDARCLCDLCVLETIDRIAGAVTDAPRRRKLLLFIGSSVTFQAGPRAPSRDLGCVRHVRDAQRRLFDSLASSNLTVHSVDPGGLVNPASHTQASISGRQSVPDPQAARRQKLQAEIAAQLSSQESLQVLPDLTGGRTVFNTNAPERMVPEIFGETQAYYVLAFEPGSRERGEPRRSIEVKVARKGVRAYAQRQHVLGSPDKPSSVRADGTHVDARAALDSALHALLPNPGRPLTLAVAAFASVEKQSAVVSIDVDVGAFANGDTPVPLELAAAAVDQRGRIIASARQTSTIELPRATSTRQIEANVRTRLDVAPGDYEIRVAVSDPAKGIVASVFSQLAIPEFGSRRLSLSDLSIETGRAAGREPAPGPSAGTTTRRVFHADDEVRAVVEIYQGTQRTDPIAPVSVRALVADATGRAVRDQSGVLPEQSFTNRRAAIALDLERLPPGAYLLTIDVSVGQQTTRRALRFVVQQD